MGKKKVSKSQCDFPYGEKPVSLTQWPFSLYLKVNMRGIVSKLCICSRKSPSQHNHFLLDKLVYHLLLSTLQRCFYGSFILWPTHRCALAKASLRLSKISFYTEKYHENNSVLTEPVSGDGGQGQSVVSHRLILDYLQMNTGNQKANSQQKEHILQHALNT